ncbi:MAG: response regulator [Pseudomonadota bacterium]|nr:response regulator [Pseudomonadota bacterium]
MAQENVDNVIMLLADGKAEMRRLMYDGFRSYGMREVRDFSNFQALEVAASAGVPPDLIVTDTTLPGGDIFELIGKIRTGDIGCYPFVPIILLTWNADGEVIKKAVDCGADYILAAPFAPADVFKRVRILINDRKPFIVTSDYIGPDRRRDPGRGDSSIPLIDVPNTLRTKANGEVLDLMELSAAVNDAMSEINDQRLVRHSYQINLLVEMIVPAYGKEEVAPVIRVHVQRLAAVAEEVSSRLAGSRFEHVAELCQNLSEVAASINSNWQSPNQKDIDLLKPLSQAVLTSFNPDRDSSDMAGEIAGMVSKFAGKINAEAEQQLN